MPARPSPLEYNEYLDFEADLARRAIRRATSPEVAIPWQGPQWYDEMPPNGRPFHHFLSVACPAPATSAFPLLQVRVQTGYKAAIKRLKHKYVPAGFVEGSGDLIWRIDVDGAFLPGFDDIRETFDPYDLVEGAAMIAFSDQLITYSIDVAAGFAGPTGAGNNILVFIDGWYAPELT